MRNEHRVFSRYWRARFRTGGESYLDMGETVPRVLARMACWRRWGKLGVAELTAVRTPPRGVGVLSEAPGHVLGEGGGRA